MVLVSRGKGQITLVDVTDNRQIMSYLTSSNQRQVIFDPTTNKYSPNYATLNNNITPEIYIAGNPNNQFSNVKSVTWYVQTNSIGGYVAITQSDSNYTLEANKSLTIKSNVMVDKLSMSYKAEIVYPDLVSKLDIVLISDIELVKISNGSQGESGVAPTTAVLSNESHTIPANESGTGLNLTGASTQLTLYEGIEDVTADWSITTEASTGVTGALAQLGTVNLGPELYNPATATNVYMYYGAENASNEEDWTSDYIDFSINTDYKYTQLYTNEFGYSATPYTAFTYFDKDKNYLYQEVREEPGLATGASKEFSYTVRSAVAGVKFIRVNGNLMFDGASFAKYIQEGVQDSRIIYTITGLTEDSGYVDFVARKGAAALTKRFTLTKVKSGAAGKTPVKGTDYFDGTPGQNGESSYLWIMYSQNADGSAMVDTPANAKYIGVATTKTNNKPANFNSYTWALFKSEGIPGEPGADGRTSYLHVKYSDNGTTFTANSGETVGAYIGTYVDFVAADSTTFSAYTWSKVKGDDGSNATAYQLIVDKKAIKKDEKGVMTDGGSITINAISQTGTASPVAYAGRFIIQEQAVQGTTWTTKYTSSANQSSYVYTASATALNVKISFYLAGGTTNLLDSETVAIISDGVTPLSLVITTPKGEVIRNSTGSLTAKATLFKAGTEITTATYKWYEMSSAGTGDTDSGAGWNLLTTTYPGGTTGYTTNTLTITPAAITSSATFMVIVTFEGLKYRNSVTVTDITDPYSVQILGPTTFRNGKGSVQLTAKLYRGGIELDPLGNSGYLYVWNSYTPAGVLVGTFIKMGKTVTINATEIASIADIRCSVSG